MTEPDPKRRGPLRTVEVEGAEVTVSGATPQGSQPRWRAALIPIAILAGCAVLAVVVIETSPVAERKARPLRARLVEVVPAEVSTATTQVVAMGTVVATREVVLKPQVSGRVVEVSPEFVPGGRFEPGQVMLRVDPSDYELAVRQRESELAQHRADLRMEQGNQSVARLEFELLGESVSEEDRDLVLREPQLDRVRARVGAAEAALAQAKLDLERTVVRSPFHSWVRERGVELGTRVDSGTVLATLVGTSDYWVEVVVPVNQLRWIEIPSTPEETGSVAQIGDAGAWGPGVYREGHVVRLLGDLEHEGRMARVLVRVEDPLALESDDPGVPPLLLGSFVNVRIDGHSLDNVVALDRTLLRDGDRVWVMGSDDALEIREVRVVFRSEDRVLVREGLRAGERLVKSDLSSPVTGMALRTRESDSESGEATATPPPTPKASRDD